MAGKLKKSIAMMLVTVLAAGMVQFPVSAETETSTENAAVSVYPAPQSITTESEEGMSLDGPIDIIVHGEQDAATLPKLEALLTEEGYRYETKTAVGSNAAIVLATNCGEGSCTICSSVADSANALSEEQGYVLKSSNDVNEKGQITIVGTDEDGTYYGVMTLLQMMKQKTSDGRIAEVTISDYPDIKFRGYVEGFYGFPWSFNDRKELFEDTSLYKMNTYIYAPKDDPYHRDSWRTLYPEEEAANMKALVEEAAENNMEFCWTIHPGADYSYSGTADYDLLIAKLEQVYSFGIRQFGIFYDDLDYSVANGTNHATVINNAYNDLQSKYGDIKPFITVVTRYTNSWGADTNSYFKPFMQNINEDTIVLWTGNSTMSAITYDYFEWPQTASGIDRDFGVWWNYPVNDYCDGHLLMSPLHCLDNNVTNICSFFLNPMSEADASKIAIYSGADYSWNMETFDSQASWERAIYELVPEANKEFERFADNIGFVSEGSGFVFNESVYLEDELTAFETAVYAGEGLEEQVQNMKMRFEQIVADADKLKTINDAELLEEITVHLDAYKVLGQSGVAAMEAYEAAIEGDIKTCLEKQENAEALLQDSTEYRVAVFENGASTQVRAYVGSHTLAPFMERILGQVTTVLGNNIAGSRKAEMLTNVQALEVQEVTVTESEQYTVENMTAVMNEGDYVAIKLPKAMLINGINATVSPAENFKLQYSLNGIEWNDANAVVCGNEMNANTAAMITYVRVLCTENNTQAVITELSAWSEQMKVATPVNPTITSDMTTYLTYNIGRAIDGDLSTWYWTAHGSSVGNYVQVDLGTEVALDSVAMYSAINNKGVIDAFSTTQLQVSDNGVTWTDVGEVKALSDFVAVDNSLYKLEIDTNGIEARYFRFKAASDSESWLMLYEVTWDISDDEPAISVSTNMGTWSSYSISNALDNDMTTKYYSSEGASAGDYIQVDFGEETTIENATIYFGGSPNDEATAIDGFSSTKLQVSTDGSAWTDVGNAIANTEYVHVGDGLYKATFDLEESSQARYVRFTAASAGDNWVQVYEVEFNETTIVGGTINIGQSDYLDDGNIATAPVIHDVQAGDTLLYPMTTITDVASIGIYQDSDTICNAAASVQKLDGTWQDIGTLDEMWNVFDINETILALKLTFNSTVNPTIYEIVVNEIDFSEDATEVCEVFPDVLHGAWYEEAVQFVHDNEIMTGTSTITFAPENEVTRAMVIETLYKMEGRPDVSEFAEPELGDYQENAWWADALKWAFAKGIATGDLNTHTFNAEQTVTREQLAAFLYRYTNYKGLNTVLDGTGEELLNGVLVSNWAKTEFTWAVEKGLITGFPIQDGFDFAPQRGANRAQLATIMQRFCQINNLP